MLYDVDTFNIIHGDLCFPKYYGGFKLFVY